MNTRLQVEHTVTEMVTGLDLVEWQLRVASGEELSIGAVEFRGHAIEFRINAEDPFNDYLPTPGQVVEWEEPAGPGVRLDSWIRPGTAVSQYYDNLMAKLVVWGSDRTQAISRGRRALQEFGVRGVSTTIPAHLAVLEHDDFLKGEHHTKWMEETLPLQGKNTRSGAGAPRRRRDGQAGHNGRGGRATVRRFLLGAGTTDERPNTTQTPDTLKHRKLRCERRHGHRTDAGNHREGACGCGRPGEDRRADLCPRGDEDGKRGDQPGQRRRHRPTRPARRHRRPRRGHRHRQVADSTILCGFAWTLSAARRTEGSAARSVQAEHPTQRIRNFTHGGSGRQCFPNRVDQIDVAVRCSHHVGET